jgi:hypothetical protein
VAFCLPWQEDYDMITIDIIDDNSERPTKTAVQTYPVASDQHQRSFDAAYESASSFYAGLLHIAQQERQARQAKTTRDTGVARQHQALIALNRIARALAAWL